MPSLIDDAAINLLSLEILIIFIQSKCFAIIKHYLVSIFQYLIVLSKELLAS